MSEHTKSSSSCLTDMALCFEEHLIFTAGRQQLGPARASLGGDISVRTINSTGTHMSGNEGNSSGGQDALPASLFFHYPLCRGNVPPARWAHAAAVVDGVLWVYGGVGNSVLDDLCALDADTLSWRVVSTHAARAKDRPEKMLGHAAAAIGSKIWIFGGQQGRKFLRTLYCFDTETCTWTRRDTDSLPPARAGHAMVTVHGSVVYLFGGQGKRLYNDLYKLDPATGTFAEVEASGKPPTPRRGHSMVWDGKDYLVCFGGINASSTDAQLTVFSLSRGAWFTPQAFGPAPSARTQHTAQLLSPGVILIFGGCNSSGTFFNDTVLLDTRTFTWHKPTLLNTAPAPRYHHTCCVVNGRTVIYGGINSKQTFDGVVIVESKFMSDISSVAEELLRMSADASSAPASMFMPTSNAPAGLATAPRMLSSLVGPPGPAPSASSAQSLGGTQTAQSAQGPTQPGQGGAGAGAGAAEQLFAGNSSKSLDAVKVQLTDLLLRRNLEEQQLHTAKKAETTESLLCKEREAREAAVKELLQCKLLLSEAEADKSAAQQQLQEVLGKANREAAALAGLRSQLEALQAKLASREEELQEARLLQDGLVKELGIMASRYSRLAVDIQEGGSGGAEHTTRHSQQPTTGITISSGISGIGGSGTTNRSSLGSMLASQTVRLSAPTPGSMAVAGGARNNNNGNGNNGSNNTEATGGVVEAAVQPSGSYSVPLPEPSVRTMLTSGVGVPALSASCTASELNSSSGGG
ncbi:hypothetical protein Agub_g13167, partial [Astrephomene gubernaculifera]